MGKNKLKKWAENKLFEHVFQPDLGPIIQQGQTFMKGEWNSSCFRNDHPITLELGCGKGEYTVGLARLQPDRNFIGIDVKGHRFHRGAADSLKDQLPNVAFLRTRIEFLESFFAPGEVDEIWLTFSDPMPKDEKGKRRITSSWFWQKYFTFLKPGGRIHLKHDNPLVYELMLEELEATPFVIEMATDDVYGDFLASQSPYWQTVLTIRTHYETIWLGEGKKIHYIRFRT